MSPSPLPSEITPALSSHMPSSSPVSAPPSRVVYISSPSLHRLSSLLPSNPGRSQQVHDLILASNLLQALDEEDESSSSSSSSANRCRVVAPLKVSKRELLRYHDSDYVDLLLKPDLSTSPPNSPTFNESSSSSGRSSSDADSDSEGSSSTSSSSRPTKRRKLNSLRRPKPTHLTRHLNLLARHGLLDDSPPFPSLSAYVLALAGAAAASVAEILEGRADVAVCWDGGRHHAMRERASGFCYVNDCVLVVLGLLKGKVYDLPRPAGIDPDGVGEDEQHVDRDDRPKESGRKPRILYLDLDVHFGDGVAQAFLSPLSTPTSQPPSVLTLSLHHTAPSFFPSGSPLSSLTPSTTSHPHTLSLPLKHGASSKTMARVWEECVEKIRRSWKPDYVVCCLGVDGMAGDGEKTGVWNLGCGEEEGELGWCVKKVLRWKEDGVKGVVLLGGGGYNHPNAARAWTTFTSIALGHPPISPPEPIPTDGISEDHLESYGPSFEMSVPLMENMKDSNTSEYLDEVCLTFAELSRVIDDGGNR